MKTKNLNWIAVFVAWFVHFNLGYVWYGSIFSGASGSAMNGMGFILAQGILGLLFTLGVNMIIILGNFYNLKSALIAALAIIVLFILPLNAGSILNQQHFLIDVGYYSIGTIVISLILGLWKSKNS